MTYISYAQNYEDVMLIRALENIDNGFYVDVGANHSESDSVTKLFYDKGWRGVNIEPLAINFDEVSKNRPRDINLNIAISDRKGSMSIWSGTNTGLATLDPEVAREHESNGIHGNWNEVKVQTLESVMQSLSEDEVHFLKIDVEGFEFEVVKSNNWEKYRPWILVIESTKPMTQIESFKDWENILLNSSYDFVYKDGLNRFYVAKEHSELKKHFNFPPNVFDDFVKRENFYEKKIDILHEQINLMAIDSEIKNTYIKNVRSSLSWKVTRPFRWFNRALKKFF